MKHKIAYQDTPDPSHPDNAVNRFHADPWVSAARGGQVLTDRQRVKLLLDALNSGSLSGDEWLSMLSGARAKAQDAPKFYLPPALRASHRALLADYVGSAPKPNARKVNANIGQSLCAVVESGVAGVLRADMAASGKLVLNYQAFAGGQATGLDYALLLLLASNGPFARDLCMCKQCGRFFLVKPVKAGEGRPRREFCTDGHRETFFGNAGSERVRKSRRERAEAKELRMDVAEYRRMLEAGATPEEWKKRRQQK